LYKTIAAIVLLLGLLLVWLGRKGKWIKRFGYALLGLAAVGLVALFATDLFGIGRGRPVFVYNMLDLERYRWRGPSLSEGQHTIVFDFKYNGPGLGKGGAGVLTVDGKEVDRKTIEHTIPLTMMADETFDIGLDNQSTVDFTYESPFMFTGTIDKLNYRLGPDQMTTADKQKAAEMLARARD
jgi:arylsulfatase